MPIIIAACVAFCDFANAAQRTAVRSGSSSVARRSVAATQTTQTATTENETESETQTTTTNEPIVVNKSNQFDTTVATVMESADTNNSFAEQIRRQRAALAAGEATANATAAQQNALKSGSNTCDSDLRKCMMNTCGKDFTKCATDGDTIFGDKLNACRRDTTCTAHEFTLFSAEIKSDRDLNVRLKSYESVIDCGNQYNACIVNECGNTYTKCLGKSAADAAIQKCSIIATECTETDSGLAARFSNAIGKLRENAEQEIKKDEERLYALRDLMRESCAQMGATFDERSFDCVYTVNFFAGNDQITPKASRKRYAGDTFVCMQEWFGVNVTTYKENAYRETRAQTAASSAMLGSGVGSAVGMVTSGAIDRAIDTSKAKKALDTEKKEIQIDQEKQKLSDDAISDIKAQLNQKANDALAKQNEDKYDIENIPKPSYELEPEDPE